MDMFFTESWFHLWVRPWIVDSEWKLALACCALGTMAALNEALRAGRTWLTTEGGVNRWKSRNHWIQVCLHFVQTMASYLLMLAVMTYSPWVLFAVCLGATVGYAIFSPLGHQPEGEGDDTDRGGSRNETGAGGGSYRRLDEEEGHPK